MQAPSSRRSGGIGRSQRGDMLLESVIGLLIGAITVVGLSVAGGRALSGYRYTKTQTQALQQLRGHLQTASDLTAFCASSTLTVTVADQTLALGQPVCTRQSVTIAAPDGTSSRALAGVLTGISVSTQGDTAKALFGGDGTLVLGD